MKDYSEVKANYRYVIGIESTKYYSTVLNDYTKTKWNEFLQWPKAKNKKALKANVKELLKKLIKANPDTEFRITSIVKEAYYDSSYLFNEKEYKRFIKNATR